MDRRKKIAGLPPGTIVFTGDRKMEEPILSYSLYNELIYEEKQNCAIEEIETIKDKNAVIWVDVQGVHNVKIIEDIGKLFNIHSLTLEDIADTEHYPKIEYFDEYIFIELKMLLFVDGESELSSEQISLILGKNFVISFQESDSGIFDIVNARIRSKGSKFQKLGADYLFYSLIDVIIDNYLIIIEKIDDEVEDLEELMVNNPSNKYLSKLHTLKRSLIFLRKSVFPLREVIRKIEIGDTSLIQEYTLFYIRDLYDHSVQIIETVESSRDVLSNLLDIYLTSTSNRMNEIMKVLTIISTIFIPLTFVAGVYGMNFEFMPEIKWYWGYPLCLLTMLTIAGIMIYFFKRKKWI